MVFDLHFPLFAILTVCLIVGAIAAVAAGMLLGPMLDRIEDALSSMRAKRASQVVVGAAWILDFPLTILAFSLPFQRMRAKPLSRQKER